jgi:hypothetical protein
MLWGAKVVKSQKCDNLWVSSGSSAPTSRLEASRRSQRGTANSLQKLKPPSIKESEHSNR